MRKEILGVILLFTLVFTAVSLLSYDPSDPSINYVRASGEVRNLFGLAGAHVAGFLVAVFGLGAFWVPIVLLVITLHVLKAYSRLTILVALAGGLLLMVATGGLLSMHQTDYSIFGKRFSSGGTLGIPLARMVQDLVNTTGGLIFLLTIWIIAFIMTTRLSLLTLLKWLTSVCRGILSRTKAAWMIWKERRHKAKRRAQTGQKLSQKKRPPVKIVEGSPKPRKGVPPPRQEVFEFIAGDHGFKLPSVNLLEGSESDGKVVDHESLQMQSRLLEKKLSDFDVSGKVVAVSQDPWWPCTSSSQPLVSKSTRWSTWQTIWP